MLNSSKNGLHTLKDLEMIAKKYPDCDDALSCNVFQQSKDEDFNENLQIKIQENLGFFKAAVIDHNGFNEEEIETLEKQIQEALQKGELALYLPQNKENE